jgi:chorismate mutase
MGYYWVPGVWLAAPQPGFLWTPGYWGFAGGAYGWHGGYWGPHVGFYGGINYGFGYGGVGFGGGEWAGGVFRYNTAVMNVDRSVVRNVYVNNTVINNTTVVNRTSFNGPGGIAARPTPQEESFGHEHHIQPTANQLAHEQTARNDRSQWASSNHGRPGTAAMDSVNGRRYNQQGRIANGIASGQLTPHETQNLEHREANINNEVHNDRAANGGKLTPQERAQVNRQQNSASRAIYDDKHNAATDHHGNNEVGARKDAQQQRIANGVRSGQLTPSETAKAEHSEQKINHNVTADRQANGGKLTPQEHKQVNQEQNKASKQIHEEKHNDTKAPRR